MKPKTATTARNLQIGDRFYKAKDRDKKVLEMVPHDTKKTYFQTYKFWCQGDYDKHPTPINGDTPVIFLRHTTQTDGSTTTTATPGVANEVHT